jgi:hypothetical protein
MRQRSSRPTKTPHTNNVIWWSKTNVYNHIDFLNVVFMLFLFEEIYLKFFHSLNVHRMYKYNHQYQNLKWTYILGTDLKMKSRK